MKPEEIFDAFYDRIYSFTLLRVGNVHDAEDLTSNVFIKVVEKLDTYRPEKAAFSTWIFTIALNEIRMYYRGRKITRPLDDIYEVADQVDIEGDLLQREECVWLIKAINELDERRKSIILLRYFGDLTDRQIAETLNLSEKNVGVILSRTRRILKDILIRLRSTDTRILYKGKKSAKAV